MQSNKIKGILCAPGQKPELKEIENNLDAMQKVVGGYIEIYSPFKDKVCVVCNEEGKDLGLQINKILCNSNGKMLDFIVGAFFLCGLANDEMRSLTEGQQIKYLNKFKRTTVIVD